MDCKSADGWYKSTENTIQRAIRVLHHTLYTLGEIYTRFGSRKFMHKTAKPRVEIRETVMRPAARYCIDVCQNRWLNSLKSTRMCLWHLSKRADSYIKHRKREQTAWRILCVWLHYVSALTLQPITITSSRLEMSKADTHRTIWQSSTTRPYYAAWY